MLCELQELGELSSLAADLCALTFADINGRQLLTPYGEPPLLHSQAIPPLLHSQAIQFHASQCLRMLPERSWAAVPDVSDNSALQSSANWHQRADAVAGTTTSATERSTNSGHSR
jgi:hypothetical protein